MTIRNSTLLPFIAALCLWVGIIPTTQAQRHKHSTPDTTTKKVYVDDEDCGCELAFIDGIQTTQRNGLFGFKLEDGTEIVPPKYKFVDEFHDGFCIVLTDYDQYGLINRRGQEVLPCIYHEINYPTEGIIKVRRENLIGFFDTTGREILPLQYISASVFSEGLAVVGIPLDSTELRFGFIDTTGRFVLPPVYEYAYPFVEGRAVVQQYSRCGLIDTAGHTLMPIKYLFIASINHGRTFARDPQSGLLAMFDRNGKQLTPFRYDDVMTYGNGLYTVSRDSLQTYLNEKGRERFGLYTVAGRFMGGYAMVERDGHCGIINTKGKQILPLTYENKGKRTNAYIFKEGLALVERNGLYGFVDTKGREVIPVQYEAAFHFSEGLCPVSRQGNWGYINHEGQEVIPFMFGPCSPFEYGRANVLYRNKAFKINPSGQCVKGCDGFPSREVQRRMAQLSAQRHRSEGKK